MTLIGINFLGANQNPDDNKPQKTQDTNSIKSIFQKYFADNKLSAEEQEEYLKEQALQNDTINEAIESKGFNLDAAIKQIAHFGNYFLDQLPPYYSNLDDLINEIQANIARYMTILSSKAFISIKGENITKEEEYGLIQQQYSYYSKEDIKARYEIEHMENRSADIIDALHSGDKPTKALADYKDRIERVKNGILIERYSPDYENMIDGYTVTRKYDSYNRLISSETVYDSPYNSSSTVTYTYNNDGSYVVKRDEIYSITEEYYDCHGVLEKIVQDGKKYPGQRYEGDYT